MLYFLLPTLSYEAKGHSMKVRYTALTDTGQRRDKNQDNHGERESPPDKNKGLILVVCDGMGGHMAGEVASQLGVKTIIDTYFSTDLHNLAAVEQAFIEANQQIHIQGHGTMGTTGVAALLVDNRVYVANVGDSRAYLIRNGTIEQISTDHSFVAEQVAAGLLTPAEARTSSYRNMITRALGHQSEVQVDLFTLPIQPNDLVLLSTDGLHNLIEDYEIVAVLSEQTLDQAAQHLVDLANARGGPDNITVIVAQVDEIEDRANDEANKVTEPLDASSVPASSVTTRSAAPDMADDTSPTPSPSAASGERPLSRAGLALASLTLALLMAVATWAMLYPVDPNPAPVATAIPTMAPTAPERTTPVSQPTVVRRP